MPETTISAGLSSARDEWLEKRFPTSTEMTLSQKRIFVLPTARAFGFLVTIMLLFVMAANFQRSLIFALSFWLLALMLVNIFFTYRNLSGLTISAVGSSNCFAGEMAAFEFEVSCPENHAVSGLVIGWKDEDAAELDLKAGQNTRIRLSHGTQNRGKFKPGRITIFSRYPTGLVVAWSYAALVQECVVFPVPRLFETSKNGEARDEAADEGKEIARGSTDFSGIRSYSAGDSPKHIHWGTYAKTGQLHTKSFVDYASEDLWLDWDKLSVLGIENKLSHLCARVLQCHQDQQTYGLKLPGSTIPPGQGDKHKDNCLIALALFAGEI